jgi:hypothetical protein
MKLQNKSSVNLNKHMIFYQILKKNRFMIKPGPLVTILTRNLSKLHINIFEDFTKKFRNKIYRISRKHIEMEKWKEKILFNFIKIILEI